MTSPKPIDIAALATDVRAGSRAALARAITLVESRRADHQAKARELVQQLLPDTGRAIRVGITGSPGVEANTYLLGEYLSVYVPTTPNPTGGYFVMLRRSECIELKMSADAALKYVVSMGVVVPNS